MFPHYVHLAIVFLVWFYVILLVIAPIFLRIRFRYHAKIDPRVVALEELPEPARSYIEPRVTELIPWNFDLVSYVNLSAHSPSLGASLALLSNRHTAEWADVTFLPSGPKRNGYVEFTTRCSDQMQIDTNSSAAASVLFPVPQHRVFRFPQVRDVFTLYRLHRMLAMEITHGALPVIPPQGQEIAELQRRLNRYGGWQQERGYMVLDGGGEQYRLTWKGAILGAWRSIWPWSALDRWRQRARSRAALNRLGKATGG